MANEVIIKGGETIVWGTDGVYSGTIVTAYDSTKSSQVKEIKDNFGRTCVVVLYDKKQEITIEIIAAAASTLEVGDVITVNGVSGVVMNVGESKKQEDAMTNKVTVSNWEQVELTPAI